MALGLAVYVIRHVVGLFRHPVIVITVQAASGMSVSMSGNTIFASETAPPAVLP